MGIILDVILLAVLILSIFMGYKKGLIGVVFNFCAFILSLIITIILYNPIANLVINNTEIDDNLKNTIIENGVIKDEESSEESQSENTEENLENTVNTYIENYVKDTAKNAANNAIEASAGVVAEKIVAIGVAIVLFIVVRLALIALKFIAEGIASLPVIKQFNKAGGTIYGILRGILVVYVVLAILFFIVSLSNSEFLIKLIDTSIISKILYAHNIILDIIF